MARPICVQSDLQLRLVVAGSAPLTVRAAMRYDVADPYAVQIGFHTGTAGDSSQPESHGRERGHSAHAAAFGCPERAAQGVAGGSRSQDARRAGNRPTATHPHGRPLRCLLCAAERPSSVTGAGFAAPVHCSAWFGVLVTR